MAILAVHATYKLGDSSLIRASTSQTGRDGLLALQIKPIQVHNLVPRRHEILDELHVAIVAGIHLRNRTQLSVRAKDQVRTSSRPLLASGLAVAALEQLAVPDVLPGGVHVQQVNKEVVRQSSRTGGEDAVRGAIVVGVEHPQTANQDGHLGRRQVQQLRLVDEVVLRTRAGRALGEIAEAIGEGLHVVEGLHVRFLLGGVHATGDERHLDRVAGVLRGLLDGRAAGQDDEISERDLLAVAAGVEARLDGLQRGEGLAQPGLVVDLPVALRGQTDACAVGTPALVAATEGGGGGPGGGDEASWRHTGGEDLVLERGNVGRVDEWMVDGGDGVLPDQNLAGDLRAEVAGAGAHVPVGELEPGAGEGVGELVRMLEEAAGDLLVGGIEAERQVGGEHGGLVLLGGIVGVGNDLVSVLGNPLVGAGGTLGELPLELEQVLQEIVVPLGRGLGPGHLQAARDGVGTLAGAVLVRPAETLGFQAGGFGLFADVVRRGSTVGLAKGVATSDEGDRLLVVHSHAAKGVPDIVSGRDGIGVTIGTLRVDIDQTHVGGGQRSLQLTRVGGLV